MQRMLVCLLCAAFMPLAWAADASRLIDTEKSVMTVHVYKSGFFSAFGHNHEISAPIERGSFSDEKPAVDLIVNARKMKVMDRDVSDKDKLTLHGQTRPVKVEVEGQSGRYHGSAQLKQTAFGITPITVGGGTVKVKNEVRVEFEIVAK